MIKVKFFAQLREQLKCSSVELEALEPMTINQLKEQLVAGQPSWGRVFNAAQLLQACNQQIVQLDAVVSPGDEVAFFPPVTGG